MSIHFESDILHLGLLVKGQEPGRIIGLSTSEVFSDSTLLPLFWNKEPRAIDSGFQAHLYTRSGDCFVVRVPRLDEEVVHKTSNAIRCNHLIWKHFTGIELATPQCKIALVSDIPATHPLKVDTNFSFHSGSMLDAVTTLYLQLGCGLLPFVINNRLLKSLQRQSSTKNTDIAEVSDSVSLLMDKNLATDLLKNHRIRIPQTILFEKGDSLSGKISTLLNGCKYAFKPSGGAAGIGLYSNNGQGADSKQIADHIDILKSRGQLPSRFQVQEFITGSPYGASAYFSLDGNQFQILEIHKQFLNNQGQYIGGHWSPSLSQKKLATVTKFYNQLNTIEELKLGGVISLDFIGDTLIEINPRITASAPIAHILHHANQLRAHLGHDFHITQIDLNTKLGISYQLVEDQTLFRVIEKTWKRHKVLCLPQGLDPFGYTRMIFINDDEQNSGQKFFMQNLMA